MKRSSNRNIPREVLRQRIGAAALHLFRQHGFERVSVDQIVAEARVSKGVFFNYFPTKADALIGYFHDLDQRIARLREETLNSRRPLASLIDFFAQAEALLEGEGSLLHSLWQAILTHPTLMHADNASRVRDREGFREFFVRARALRTVGPSVDPATAADLVDDLWTASVTMWLVAGQSHSFAETVAPKLRLLFHGLQPRRKA